MKGLSTTILIVVTAVVILVAALVMLTIFSSGIQNVASISQGATLCISEAQISCGAGGWPVTWNSPTKRLPDGTPKACKDLVQSCSSCTDVASCKPV